VVLPAVYDVFAATLPWAMTASLWLSIYRTWVYVPSRGMTLAISSDQEPMPSREAAASIWFTIHRD
jgi:hypothetical protein